MSGVYADMSNSPTDALRRDLFASRTNESFLIEAFQTEIAEQREEIQYLRDREREHRAETDHLRRFFESLLMRYAPPKCYFCNHIGHIKRDCFSFRAIQNIGYLNNRSTNANFHDNRGRNRFGVTFTHNKTGTNNRNDSGNPSNNTNYSRNAYSLGPRFNRGRSLSCGRHRSNNCESYNDRGRSHGRSCSFDRHRHSNNRDKYYDNNARLLLRDNSTNTSGNNYSRGNDYDKSSAVTEDTLFEPDT
jgi:hypothetical protein